MEYVLTPKRRIRVFMKRMRAGVKILRDPGIKPQDSMIESWVSMIKPRVPVITSRVGIKSI
jgi:hypothetical protein